MAYEGKSSTSSNKNFRTANDVKLRNYTSSTITSNSKSSNTKYTGVTADSKTTTSKNTRPNKAYNSGTPCTSKAFTPMGKPSAIRTVKKDNDFTSDVPVNDSSHPSKSSRPNKGFNSDTPCTSKEFTSLGKPSAIRTEKNFVQNKKFTSEVHVNDSNLLPHKDFRSNKGLNSDPSRISKAYTSLENINSKKSNEKFKNFILRKHVSIAIPSPFKNTNSNKKLNSDTSCTSKKMPIISSEKSPAVSSVKNTLKASNSNLQKTFSDSKSSMKHATSNKKLNSDTSCTSKGMSNTSAEKSSAASTVKNPLKKSQKTVNDSKSPPFKHTTTNAAQNHLMGYHTLLEKNSAVRTQNNTINPQDFNPRKSINDSISSPTKDTRPNKEFNSASPCTSKGIPHTSSEKSSAISTVTNSMKPNDFTLQKTFNDSKSPSVSSEKSSAASTVINSVEPSNFILQKTFNDSKSPSVSSDKSSVVSTVTNNVEPSDFILQKTFNDSKSPSASSEKSSAAISITNSVEQGDSISQKTFNDFIFPDTSSKKLSVVSTVTNSVEPSDFILQKTFNDSNSPSVSSEKSSAASTITNSVEQSDFVPQKTFNDSKSPSVSSEKSHASSTITSSAEHGDFISQKTFDDSKSPSVSSEKSHASSTITSSAEHGDFISQKTFDDSKFPDTSSEKSSAVNTVTNSMKPNDFNPQKNFNVSKSPPLKNTTSNSTQQRLMRYYTFLETKSAIITGENTMIPNDFTPENPVSDTKVPSFKDTVYDTVHQSTFNNLYSTSRKSSCSENKYGQVRGSNFGFVKVNEKVKESGSSQVHPKADRNRSSSNVDLLRCIICIDKERDTVFQPCGHLVVCRNCAKNVDAICPMCRKRIKKKIKAYIN